MNVEPKELEINLEALSTKLAEVVETSSKENNILDYENENIPCKDYNLNEEIQNSKQSSTSLFKTVIDKSESVNQGDSFWIDPIANNNFGSKTNLELELSSQHSDKDTSDLVFSDYKSPNNTNEKASSDSIDKIENNEIIKENNLQNDLNANDTDLDQTFNLNASYEIFPNNNVEIDAPNNVEPSDEIDNKIIDCNELEENESENEQEMDNSDIVLETQSDHNLDNNQDLEKNTILFMQTTTTTIIETQVNNETPILDTNDNADNQVNEENLTTIIPEELNKIKESEEEEASNEVSDEIGSVQNLKKVKLLKNF